MSDDEYDSLKEEKKKTYQLGVPQCVCINIFALGLILAKPKSLIFARSSAETFIYISLFFSFFYI